MLTLLAAFLVSAVINLFLVRFSFLHVKLTGDWASGPQKLHHGLVPRVGGLGVLLGVAGGGIVLYFQPEARNPELVFLFLLVALPAFVAGFGEDLFNRIPPRIRLLSALISGALGFVILHAAIRRIGVPGVDKLLSFWPLALMLTAFAVAGMSHAINIIDGLNGLSAGVALLILLAFAYVAFKVNDLAMFHVCLAGAGAILGFLIWNFPGGLLFLGDGGAYLVGVFIAEVAILLVMRNPRVSPWFPMLVVIYPVFETVYSIYRRVFVRGRSPGLADALHLHSLVYRRMLSWMLSSKLEARRLVERNAMTTCYLWGLVCLCIIPAVLLYRYTYWLMGLVVVFAATYVWLYTCIVKFRSPVWLRRLFAIGRIRDLSTQKAGRD